MYESYVREINTTERAIFIALLKCLWQVLGALTNLVELFLEVFEPAAQQLDVALTDLVELFLEVFEPAAQQLDVALTDLVELLLEVFESTTQQFDVALTDLVELFPRSLSRPRSSLMSH